MSGDRKIFKSYDEGLLLFLYRDVGLLWEKKVKKDETLASTRSNKDLQQFLLKNKSIKYFVTNTDDMVNENASLNEVFYTDTGKNIVSSLLKHLRNSIMHGHYALVSDGNTSYIEFRDEYRQRVTMYGKIEVKTLKQLVACFENK